MPDISMCMGEGCNKKLTCYRYRAIPSPKWQSYIRPDPLYCDHYWEIGKESTVMETADD